MSSDNYVKYDTIFYSSFKRCMNNAQKNKHAFYFKWGKYRYASCLNIAEWISIYKKIPQIDLRYYEYIRKTDNVKLYFTLKYTSAKDNIMPLKSFITALTQYLKFERGIILKEEETIMLSASSLDNHFYHIIIDNGVMFENIEDAKKLYLHLRDYFHKAEGKIFKDCFIYNQAIKQVKFIVEDNYNAGDCLLMYNSEENGIYLTDKEDGEISNRYFNRVVDEDLKIYDVSDIDINDIINIRNNGIVKIYYSKIVSEEIIIQATNLIRRYNPDVFFIECCVLGVQHFKIKFSKSTYACQICQTIKEHTYEVLYNNEQYEYCCEGNKRDDIEESYLTSHIFIEPDTLIQDWDYDYDEQYMRDLPEIMNGQTALVQAKMGCGKSYLNKYWIRDSVKPYESILIITYRISLANKLAEDLNRIEVDMCSYLDKECFEENANRLVICLDSMYKLTKDKYSIVIIDEIDSILSHFQSSLMTGVKKLVMTRFIDYLTKCDKLLVYDANINNTRVLNVLKSMRRESGFIYIRNRHIPEYHINKKLIYHMPSGNSKENSDKDILKDTSSDEKQFNAKILSEVLSGLKIGVVSMSMKWTTKIAAILEEAGLVEDSEENRAFFCEEEKKYYKLYNSEIHRDVISNDIRNINNVWSREHLQVVIYSPSISSGISYDIDDSFDKIYAFAMNLPFGPSVDDFLQMLFRIRKLKQGEIHMFFSSKYYQTKQYPRTLEDIEYEMSNKTRWIFKTAGEPYSGAEIYGGVVVYKKDTYYKIWIENLKRKFISLSIFFEKVMEHFKSLNIPCYEKKVYDNERIEERLFDTEENEMERFINDVSNIEAITDIEFKKIERRKNDPEIQIDCEEEVKYFKYYWYVKRLNLNLDKIDEREFINNYYRPHDNEHMERLCRYTKMYNRSYVNDLVIKFNKKEEMNKEDGMIVISDRIMTHIGLNMLNLTFESMKLCREDLYRDEKDIVKFLSDNYNRFIKYFNIKHNNPKKWTARKYLSTIKKILKDGMGISIMSPTDKSKKCVSSYIVISEFGKFFMYT
jgi:hypothetical protein